MELKLKVLEGKNAGQEIAIQGQKFIVGRAEDCHLRPGSDLISRHHCVLLIDEGYVGVRDFGSKNGTYVNEERVVGERELKAGDRLTIGPLRFEIHMGHGLAAKKRPPVADIKEAAARAAQDAAQDPLDVTQWLASEPTEDTHHSAPASITDTDSINLSTTQTMAIEPVAEEPEQKHAPGKRPPGKLPKITPNVKDSQEAAMNMLNRLRKRR
jgi:predicted component of type VI protein secretion system